MNRDVAAGDGMLAWKTWVAKFTLRRALYRAQMADGGAKRAGGQLGLAAVFGRPARDDTRAGGRLGLAAVFGRPARDDTRATAVRRAAAAELIAQEANAARLKALLDAAREQKTVRTIESAEQRFAEARGDWEAAQRPLLAARDEVCRDDAPAGEADAVAGRLDRAASRRLALWSMAVAALVFTGAAVYFVPDFGDDAASGDGIAGTVPPASSARSAYADIDPLASLPRPTATAANAVPAVEETAGKTPTVDEAAVVTSVNALDTEALPRADRGRGGEQTRRTAILVPTPARNPFYDVPSPPPARAAPAFLNDYE